MKLEINTVTKTIAILDTVTIKELTEFLEKNGWLDWKIQPEININLDMINLYNPSYIPKVPYPNTTSTLK